MATAGFLVLALPGRLPPTFFSRTGLLLPLGLAISLFGLGWLVPSKRD